MASTKLSKAESNILAKLTRGNHTVVASFGYAGRSSSKSRQVGTRDLNAARKLVARGLATVAHEEVDHIVMGNGKMCTFVSLTLANIASRGSAHD